MPGSRLAGRMGETPAWVAVGLVVRSLLRTPKSIARGAAELQFPSCPGTRASWAGTREPSWSTDPWGRGEVGPWAGGRVRIKGDQDLAFFLDAAARCPVLYGARDGAECRWLTVAGCLWFSL